MMSTDGSLIPANSRYDARFPSAWGVLSYRGSCCGSCERTGLVHQRRTAASQWLRPRLRDVPGWIIVPTAAMTASRASLGYAASRARCAEKQIVVRVQLTNVLAAR